MRRSLEPITLSSPCFRSRLPRRGTERSVGHYHGLLKYRFNPMVRLVSSPPTTMSWARRHREEARVVAQRCMDEQRATGLHITHFWTVADNRPSLRATWQCVMCKPLACLVAPCSFLLPSLVARAAVGRIVGTLPRTSKQSRRIREVSTDGFKAVRNRLRYRLRC